MSEIVEAHWSHGPHYQFDDSIVFITWRLAFTLPAYIIALFRELSKHPEQAEHDAERLRQDNAYLYQKFLDYDLALASYQNPGFSLNEPNIAELIKASFHSQDGLKYELHAYVLMSNHVHLLIRALTDADGKHYHISDIVQSLKRYTATQINRYLHRAGTVWDDFYFDRIIRNQKNYFNVVNYILRNPVTAGLVDDVEKWKDSYVNNSYGGW